MASVWLAGCPSAREASAFPAPAAAGYLSFVAFKASALAEAAAVLTVETFSARAFAAVEVS